MKMHAYAWRYSPHDLRFWKPFIDKQTLDQAKKELECECSLVDTFISTFSEPGATSGQHDWYYTTYTIKVETQWKSTE